MHAEMTVGEFIREGYLQEVNRRFFHPLGLALCVHLDGNYDIDGEEAFWEKNSEIKEFIISILDSRDDPEGYIFNEFSEYEKERARRIDEVMQEKCAYRELTLGKTEFPDGIQKL